MVIPPGHAGCSSAVAINQRWGVSEAAGRPPEGDGRAGCRRRYCTSSGSRVAGGATRSGDCSPCPAPAPPRRRGRPASPRLRPPLGPRFALPGGSWGLRNTTRLPSADPAVELVLHVAPCHRDGEPSAPLRRVGHRRGCRRSRPTRPDIRRHQDAPRAVRPRRCRCRRRPSRRDPTPRRCPPGSARFAGRRRPFADAVVTPNCA